jgi:hypothetical protein
VSKPIDELAEVLRALTERRRPEALAEEVAALRLVVEKMATSLAVHEVQLAKIRETCAALAVRDSGE